MAGAGAENKDSNRAMELLGQKTFRIAELESQNAALRAEIDSLRNSSDVTKPVAVEDAPESVPTAISPSRFEALNAKYKDLSQRYRQLHETHKNCTQRIAFANKKYSESKEVARQWKIYADRKHAEKLQRHAEPILARPSTPSSTSGAVGTDVNTENGEDLTPRPLSKPIRSSPTVDELLDPSHGDEYRTSTNRSSLAPKRVSSSQTTASEELSSPPRKRETSSDSEPVVVSARSLKRKRSRSAQAMPPPVRIKLEPKDPHQPIEIKSEDFSSPVHLRQPVMRLETSDLDAFVAGTETPRSRRRVKPRAISEEPIRLPKLPTRVSSLSGGDMLDSAEVDPDKILLSPPRREPGVLEPLSINVPDATRARARLQRKTSDVGAAAKAALLSEDGESQAATCTKKQPATISSKQNARHEARRRLDSLLDDTGTDRQQLPRNHTPETAVPRKNRPLTPVSEPGRATKLGDAFQARPASASAKPTKRERLDKSSPKGRAENRNQRPRGIGDSPPPVHPEDEPLRLRPFTSLQLEDFKINPKYLGEAFAFADTFRSRDQRRCMQGCTRPNCCGDIFRQAVQMNGQHASRESDEEALEAYFGPNWDQIIGAYPKERRDDLVEEARASAFANKFGKHRHAFERRSTPPGFWRTDMPTTQEEADDRAKAQQMVLQKVEERWREAMRGGGRWLFRDE